MSGCGDAPAGFWMGAGFVRLPACMLRLRRMTSGAVVCRCGCAAVCRLDRVSTLCDVRRWCGPLTGWDAAFFQHPTPSLARPQFQSHSFTGPSPSLHIHTSLTCLAESQTVSYGCR
jgi:hypothetical protein